MLSTIIGGTLGAVGAAHSIYTAFHYRNGPNAARNWTKAGYNTAVFVAATFFAQPELGVADAIFDASGGKDKILDMWFGEVKPEISPLPKVGTSSMSQGGINFIF